MHTCAYICVQVQLGYCSSFEAYLLFLYDLFVNGENVYKTVLRNKKLCFVHICVLYATAYA